MNREQRRAAARAGVVVVHQVLAVEVCQRCGAPICPRCGVEAVECECCGDFNCEGCGAIVVPPVVSLS